MVTGVFDRFRTLLVTEGTGFYNPSNTALEAVVSFIRAPGAQASSKTGATSASGYKVSNTNLRDSQEH
jgi:hypothetical protein